MQVSVINPNVSFAKLMSVDSRRKRERSELFLTCLRWLQAFGISPSLFLAALRRFPQAIKEYLALREANQLNGATWDLNFAMPCLHDRHGASGDVSGHYFHQDLLVARRIFSRCP